MDSNVMHPSHQALAARSNVGTLKMHANNIDSSNHKTCIDCADRIVRNENARNQHEQPELLLGPSALELLLPACCSEYYASQLSCEMFEAALQRKSFAHSDSLNSS